MFCRLTLFSQQQADCFSVSFIPARPRHLRSAILWQKGKRLWREKHIWTAEERIPSIPWSLLRPPETTCKKDNKACLHQRGLAWFSEQTGGGRIPQRGNPDRRLPQYIKQNRLVAQPHHPGAHVRATLQRRSRLRNAEKKNTGCYKQVCDNSKTIVSHEWH